MDAAPSLNQVRKQEHADSVMDGFYNPLQLTVNCFETGLNKGQPT